MEACNSVHQNPACNMKLSHLFLSLVLSLTFTLTFNTPVQAQHYGYGKKKKKKKKADKEEKTFHFTDQLWYGGGGALNFSGGNNFNYFVFGLSPMVGYKIIEPVSIGPRLSFSYNYLKGQGTDGNFYKTQPISYSVGVFTRFKFLRSLFVHAELEHESREIFYVDPFGYLAIDYINGTILTDRITRENVYLGAGYNSSSPSGWGYEILVLYNFLIPENSYELPFNIRVGLTYRF